MTGFALVGRVSRPEVLMNGVRAPPSLLKTSLERVLLPKRVRAAAPLMVTTFVGSI